MLVTRWHAPAVSIDQLSTLNWNIHFPSKCSLMHCAVNCSFFFLLGFIYLYHFERNFIFILFVVLWDGRESIAFFFNLCVYASTQKMTITSWNLKFHHKSSWQKMHHSDIVLIPYYYYVLFFGLRKSTIRHQIHNQSIFSSFQRFKHLLKIKMCYYINHQCQLKK